MHADLRYGRFKYIFFVLVDLVCILVANMLSLWIYIGSKDLPYTFNNHYSVVIAMLVIDILVSYFFNTLKWVLRRKIRDELYESARHVVICLVILGIYLFITRNGIEYSRAVVFLAYGLDYVFILCGRTVARFILSRVQRKQGSPTALLMTTDRFMEEGIEQLRALGRDVQYLYLLMNIGKSEIDGIPVLEDAEEAVAVLCWRMIDRVYIYGLDHQMVPELLTRACKKMNLRLDLVDFSYRIIDVKTIKNDDPKYGSLSFVEGKRDIPFPIRRVYWITETEADLQRGFHSHKLNCQLLYCPYGKIDILLDDGTDRNVITLDEPNKGLIIMPGLWREMIWRESNSVLCVLASEYYDAQEYIRDYDEFISYCKKYREAG